MKIKAEVLAVETTGDALKVRCQGQAKGAAQWRPLLAFVLELPETEPNRRAFYVGRTVSITVDAK